MISLLTSKDFTIERVATRPSDILSPIEMELKAA